MKKEKLSFRESLQILGKAFHISFQVKSKASMVISLIGLFMAFLPVLISSTLGYFSDEIQMVFQDTPHGVAPAIVSFIALAILYIIQVAFQSLQNYFSENDTLRVRAYVKEHILDNLCSVQYKYINNADGYIEKVAFADNIAGDRTASCIQSVFTWLQYSITFVSIFVVLLKISPLIVVVILVTSIPAVILSYKQNDETFVSTTRWTKEGHLLMHSFAEMVDHRVLPEIRYLSIADFLANQRNENAKAFLNKKKKMIQKHVLYNSVADILRSGVYLLIMLLITKRIFENPTLGIGSFMLAFTLTGQFQNVSANLITSILSFFNDIFYMKAFFALETYDRENAADPDNTQPDTEIRFEHVNFRYPGNNRDILQDINVIIHPGEKVAIVGENGSGKSTFINLLCGFYDPTNGRVLFGGQKVSNQISAVRKNLSVVFQDYGKYETSIRENITLSDHTRTGSDAEIMSICDQTGLTPLIEEQPYKLDEALGIFSDYGKNLSGGQWQRIAITRALYRRASVMILDEPTAALDPKAEAELYSSFADLTNQKTTILITHRLGAIKLVNRILVFHDGKVVEEGNHEDLMKMNGKYAEMYRAQAHWYK